MVSDRIQSSPSKVPKEEYAYAKLLELGLRPPFFFRFKGTLWRYGYKHFFTSQTNFIFFERESATTSPDGPEPNGWISIFESINTI